MREIRQSGSVRGVRRNPYPYRDPRKSDAVGSAGFGGQATAAGGSTKYFFPDKADFGLDLSIRPSGRGG